MDAEDTICINGRTCVIEAAEKIKTIKRVRILSGRVVTREPDGLDISQSRTAGSSSSGIGPGN